MIPGWAVPLVRASRTRLVVALSVANLFVTWCLVVVLVAGKFGAPATAGGVLEADRFAAGSLSGSRYSSSGLAFALARSCASDDQAQVVIGEGTGPTVALIGDSLSSQLRDRFLAQPDVRAVVAAHCGAQIESLLDDGTVGEVMAQRPDIVVAALGTNAISEHFAPAPHLIDRRLASIDRLLDETRAARCTVWLNVAAVDRGAPEPDAAMFIALARRFNDRLVRAAASRVDQRVVVADWDGLVAARPGVLMPDGIHLTPDGEVARLGLIRSVISERCGLVS